MSEKELLMDEIEIRIFGTVMRAKGLVAVLIAGLVTVVVLSLL